MTVSACAMANPPGWARNLTMRPKISVLGLLCFDQSCRSMVWPRLRQGRTKSGSGRPPEAQELLARSGNLPDRKDAAELLRKRGRVFGRRIDPECVGGHAGHRKAAGRRNQRHQA